MQAMGHTCVTGLHALICSALSMTQLWMPFTAEQVLAHAYGAAADELISAVCLQVLQLAQTSPVQGEDRAKMIEAMLSMRVLNRMVASFEKVRLTHAQPLHGCQCAAGAPH